MVIAECQCGVVDRAPDGRMDVVAGPNIAVGETNLEAARNLATFDA